MNAILMFFNFYITIIFISTMKSISLNGSRITHLKCVLLTKSSCRDWGSTQTERTHQTPPRSPRIWTCSSSTCTLCGRLWPGVCYPLFWVPSNNATPYRSRKVSNRWPCRSSHPICISYLRTPLLCVRILGKKKVLLKVYNDIPK